MQKRDKIIATIFLVTLLVLTPSFVFAQNPLDGFVGQIEDGTRQIEETGQKVERLTKEDVKWEHLGEQWKRILLENEFVSFMDGLFKRGNILFVILFGRDYSLSLTLFFLIFLWVYFLSQFHKIISTFSSFDSKISLIISFGMVVILAQLRFFDWASEMIFKLIFYRQGTYRWLWAIGSILITILVTTILSRFFSSFRRAYKKLLAEKLEKAKREGTEFYERRIKLIGETLSRALKRS